MKPLLLDLYRGAGGATKGYQLAGFYVVGVDIEPQPNYCGDEFYQDDALKFPIKDFHVIHASPPYQAYISRGRTTRSHPDLIAATRSRIRDKVYVIENILGSPLENPILLCGEMFGLQVVRHRLFESNVPLRVPHHIPHRGRVKRFRNDGGYYFAVLGHEVGTLKEWSSAVYPGCPSTS
jgi:hypothetical protein